MIKIDYLGLNYSVLFYTEALVSGSWLILFERGFFYLHGCKQTIKLFQVWLSCDHQVTYVILYVQDI